MALFTIGYSGLDHETFIDRLGGQRVDVVCDVRSTPFSKFKPDFSRGALKRHLNAAGLKYIFLGAQLGARPQDKSCYVDGQARYDRIAETEPFREGMTRIIEGAEKLNLALVCSERDPIECHRAILVCHRLGPDLRGSVRHIHTDGLIEEQAALDERLMRLYALTPPPLLSAPGDWENARDAAFERQADAIAYREKG